MVASILVSLPVVVGQRNFFRRSSSVPDRSTFPMWKNDGSFQRDVFTFARVRYKPHYFRGWDADYPDADWNFSLRLQQLTSLEVNPNPVVVELTDSKLSDFPFLFLSAPYSVIFSEAEITGLRDYLANGGFLMVDEFWGTVQWNHFYAQMKRVLPNCEPRELSLEHEIFHTVYDFDELPQATAIHFWKQGYTYHPVRGTEQDHSPHFYGMFDAQNRMMVLLCYNNDLCDGWEREGEDKEFFQRFSLRCSYPMGINIVTYAMTH